MSKTKELQTKWAPVMAAEAKNIKVMGREAAVVNMLESQEVWNKSGLASIDAVAPVALNETTNVTGAAVAGWSPVLIKMVKRMAPNLVAHDLMGVQPLSTPDGLIFAMRARYTNQTGAEAFYNEPQAGFSGGVAAAGDASGFPKDLIAVGTPVADPVAGDGMSTSDSENLGGSKAWSQMAVSVEKSSVTAKSRGLYADYSHELRQDMMAVHGEDVDAILTDMLGVELQAEINRQLIRTVNIAAVLGCQSGTAKAGVFDLNADADGRWFLEKLKALLFRVEIEANTVAIQTRRGKANRVICAPNVASALAMAGMLDFTPALAQNATLDVDATGNTFAGVLTNGMRVYIDPYAVLDYITLGYKGESALDAGIFFAPYTPLEMYRTVSQDGFQPRLAFKTRYGIAANPFEAKNADGSARPGDGLGQGANRYFRKFAILGVAA